MAKLVARDEIISKTREFLKKYLDNKQITLDQNIFGKGLVNSLFAMQLVMFVEKEFELQVEPSELDQKYFSTLSAIANFVSSKSS